MINFPQLAAKLEALRDEYMRYAVEKCAAVLREHHSAVETITGNFAWHVFSFCLYYWGDGFVSLFIG